MKQRLIDANALHYHMGVNQNDKQIFYVTGEDIDAAPTDAVRLALENLVARGNLAVLCTGRPPCNVPPALKTLPFAGMVTLAGGHVELDGEVVRDVGMPSDVVELLVSCCERARVPAYFESSSRGVVLAWPGVFSLFDTFGEFSERVGIEELRGVLAGIDVGKVVFDSEHIELLITMAPAITERCSVCNIGDGLYEVTVPGITKFDGMRAVWSRRTTGACFPLLMWPWPWVTRCLPSARARIT